MLLDAGMDTGPVLAQAEIPIGPEDTFGTVHDRLAAEGASLLLETLSEWKDGRIAPRAQDNARATCAPPVAKGELRIQWNLPAKEIINKIRAFDPWPGAYFLHGGKRVKCFRARRFAWTGADGPGKVAGISESGLIVAGGDGQALSIDELQLEGQRRIRASEFIRGRPIPAGSLLE